MHCSKELKEIFMFACAFTFAFVFCQRCLRFSSGEKDGEVVASAIRIPGNGVYFGSYYYVAQAHRKYGYGTRLRDQVAGGSNSQIEN